MEIDDNAPPAYNFGSPDDVENFEKETKKISKKDQEKLNSAKNRLKKSIDNLPKDVSKVAPEIPLSTQERYKRAWKKTYNGLQAWRQKEIDTQLKTGKLSDKDWDNEFSQQVISLAESDDPLED